MEDFRNEIRLRAVEAQASLDQARAEGDDYLAEIRLGEMESLARLAAEHAIRLVDVERSLAANGLPTPAIGIPSVELTTAPGDAGDA